MQPENATRCVNIMVLLVAALLPTECISLPHGKQGTRKEPQSEGNADISGNTCTVIIKEVTSWEGERADSQAWVQRGDKTRVCLMAGNNCTDE